MREGGSHSRPYIPFGKHLFIISCHLPLSPNPLSSASPWMSLPGYATGGSNSAYHSQAASSLGPQMFRQASTRLIHPYSPCSWALPPPIQTESHSRFFLLSPQAPVNDPLNDPLTKLSSVISRLQTSSSLV